MTVQTEGGACNFGKVFGYNIFATIMKSSAFLLTLMLISCGMLSGCLDDDGGNEPTVVGIYTADTIGTATSNNNDILLELTLVSSDYPIRFTDGTGSQDGKEYFTFTIKKVHSGGKTVHDCKHEDDATIPEQMGVSSSCEIIETSNDRVWSVGETITLQENTDGSGGGGVCDTTCTIILEICNTVNAFEESPGCVSTNSNEIKIEYQIN